MRISKLERLGDRFESHMQGYTEGVLNINFKIISSVPSSLKKLQT
jgi:hypothetical protein